MSEKKRKRNTFKKKLKQRQIEIEVNDTCFEQKETFLLLGPIGNWTLCSKFCSGG